MLKPVVLPAERLPGEADTTSLLAAAGVIEIELDVLPVIEPFVVSVAVIVCGPAASSVAVTVATPPENVTGPNVAPPGESLKFTVSEKFVTGLPKLSSAVTVNVVVLPAERLDGDAETTSLLAAAGVIEIELDVLPVIEPFVVSVAVIVCGPALSRVAVTVATPPENVTGPNVVPPGESLKLTVSEKFGTGLPKLSSAVTVNLVVLPAERLDGDAETTSLLAAAGVIEIELDVLPVIEPFVVSVAVIVCGPAESSVAVTVATPPENVTGPNVAPPGESLKLTVSEKFGTGLPKLSSAVTVNVVVLPAERLDGDAETTSLLAAAGVTEIELLAAV